MDIGISFPLLGRVIIAIDPAKKEAGQWLLLQEDAEMIGSQEKLVLLNVHRHDELHIANAVTSGRGIALLIPTREPARRDVSEADVLILLSKQPQPHIPLTVHAWMAFQMVLSTPQRRVYLALFGKTDEEVPVVLLYRIMLIEKGAPSFLLVNETLRHHAIEIFDPTLLTDGANSLSIT